MLQQCETEQKWFRESMLRSMLYLQARPNPVTSLPRPWSQGAAITQTLLCDSA